jgi:hypothetical protein
LYVDPVAQFLESFKKHCFFVGFADNVGSVLTFKISENYLSTVLHRSVVRSAADVDLQLGTIKNKAYQSYLMASKLQYQLDHLRQRHILVKHEDRHDRSWKCIKVLKYSKEKAADDGVDP